MLRQRNGESSDERRRWRGSSSVGHRDLRSPCFTLCHLSIHSCRPNGVTYRIQRTDRFYPQGNRFGMIQNLAEGNPRRGDVTQKTLRMCNHVSDVGLDEFFSESDSECGYMQPPLRREMQAGEIS